MATAKKTRKKPTAKKKAARRKKAAPKKKAARKAAPKAEVPVKAVEPAESLEARLLAPLAQMERMMDEFRRGGLFRPMAFDWPRMPELPSLFEAKFPSIDVVDRDKEIVVKAEVPGIDKEDLDVSVTDRTLTIKGETQHEEEKEEGDMHRREIRAGSFSRTVTLPADVDGRKAKASYKDGVVELRLPKLRRSKKHTVKLD